MINSTQFLKLLSLCVKEIQSFSPEEICKLVHLTTIDIEWRDPTLLRILEPRLMSSLAGFDSSEVVDLIESYSKLRCGSRPFWESLISSLLSYTDRDQLKVDTDVFRLIRCILNDEVKFYKPLLVLEKLQPLVNERLLTTNSIAEIADYVCVYCRWPKAAGKSRCAFHDFIDQCLFRTRSVDISTDFSSAIRILSSVHQTTNSPSEETLVFVNRLLDDVTSSRNIIPSLRPSELVSLAQGFSKFTDHVNAHHLRKLYVSLHDSLVPVIDQVSSNKLALVSQIFSKCFGLVNTYKFVTVNFGPVDSPKSTIPPLIEAVANRCVKEGTMAARISSVRQIARLGEAMANVRLDNYEFWASFVTSLSGFSSPDSISTFGDLSPEELGQLAFTFAEMNLSVPDDLRNSLVMLIFEKIHLMENFFNNIIFFFTRCFERDESMKLIGQLIEFMDTEGLEVDGSLVLGNMCLRSLGDDLGGKIEEFLQETDGDVIAFWRNAQSIMDPEIWKSIRGALEAEFGGRVDTDVDFGGCLIDFRVPSVKLAVLVSSPLQLIGATAPTGTAILRYRAAVVSLPKDWTVVNISAVEWNQADEERRHEIIADLRSEYRARCEEECSPDTIPSHEDAMVAEVADFGYPHEDDLGPFIQKDRSAAHRKRAPPDTSLPWVPSVFTLKRKPRTRSSRRR